MLKSDDLPISIKRITPENPNKEVSIELKGWLSKWTNYIKGYQKRWFVLHDGTLSYYRNQAEVGHTCRGSINLQGAFIHHTETDSSRAAGTFVVSNGGTQTFHLKASNESERHKWVTNLELARVRAIKAAESEEEEEMKLETETNEIDHGDLLNTLRCLQLKIDDLATCQGLIGKHGHSLQKSLADLEQAPDLPTKIRDINERATLFRITTNAMITACTEFTSLAQSQGKKWQRLLQMEHEKRLRLQNQIEELAKQHSALERAAFKQQSSGRIRSMSPIKSDEESETFHDAAEELDAYDEDAGAEAESIHSREGEDEEEAKTIKERRKTQDLLRCQIVTVPQGFEDRRQDELTSSASTNRLNKSPSIEFQNKKVALRQRRKTIPPRLNISINLWSIMKNCIGKELTKIPMPVNFNEPLSMIQRLTEDFEYAHILDRAAKCTDSLEQMCFVAAFTVSAYSTTAYRINKPFNPLLGETYECDRTDDLGWRAITEQVSHHPPTAAQHVEGRHWTMWQEFTMSSKFRGKYLSIIPMGMAHLQFKNTGNVYSWRKVTTTVHNIIVGKLWVDNHGDMTIENNKTGDKCHLKYIPYSYFSRETPRKVTGIVTDKHGAVKWVVQGTWDDYVEYAKVAHETKSSTAANGTNNGGNGKPVIETAPPKMIWKKNASLPGAERIYHFTQLALELNEPEPSVAPTDSRLRPDQRLMEEGRWDESNTEKVRLEEQQRLVRRQRETEAEQAMMEGQEYNGYEPLWFVKQQDVYTGNLIHVYTGEYWKCKEKQDWSRCPTIY